MHRILRWSALALSLSLVLSSTAHAQYAVGHRSFGGGTTAGIGWAKWDWQFSHENEFIKASRVQYLLPTLEFKVFLSDKLSLDLNFPVVNMAASNAIQDHFHVTGDFFLNFHASAPSSMELFVAPGIGFSYASWESEDKSVSGDAWAFHVPCRLGLEFNNQRRTFSFFVAIRPFFSLVHGYKGDTGPGGGAFLELGVMAYSVKYRADRW